MDPSEILDVNMLSPGDIILAHDLLKYRSSQDDLINVDKLLKFYKMHTDDIQFSIYFEPDLINNIKSKSMLELFLSYGIDNPYFPYINFLSSSRPDLNRIVFNYMKTHIRDRERLWNFIENLAFNAKLINDNCEILLEAIDFFEFDRDKTLNKLQGYQPTPICKISRKYSSGRGYLIPKQISAFGNIELPLLNFSQMNIITNKDFINNEYCFCANISWGIYENFYIPVMRYGRNEGHGFYGMINDKYANFTWYYVEPESNVYLYAPKILATKNKITAKLTLLHLNNYDVVDELENIKRLFSIDETLLLLNLNQLEDLILSPQRTLITSSLDNYLMDGLQIKYGYGELDGYDEAITTLARNVGIDVVIFTHQPGTAKRLVSECVDTRMRLISFQNLFTSQ